MRAHTDQLTEQIERQYQLIDELQAELDNTVQQIADAMIAGQDTDDLRRIADKTQTELSHVKRIVIHLEAKLPAARKADAIALHQQLLMMRRDILLRIKANDAQRQPLLELLHPLENAAKELHFQVAGLNSNISHSETALRSLGVSDDELAAIKSKVSESESKDDSD